MNRQKKYHGFVFPFVGLFLLGFCGFVGADVPTTRASGSADRAELPAMSRYLPVWTRGYLEVYHLDRQFDHLRWLVQLIESPVEPDTGPISRNPVPDITRQFDAVLQHNLHISARELADQLLRGHFVLAWGGPAMRDQFALICEINDVNTINRFLTINKAVPDEVVTSKIEGETVQVATYKLTIPSIRAAVLDNRRLILATVGGGSRASMYHAMVELAQGHSEMSLQKSSQFKLACSRMKPGYASMFILLMDMKNKLYPGGREALYDQVQQSISHVSLAGYPQKGKLKIQVNVQPRWVDPELLPDEPIKADPLLRKMIDPRSNLVYISSVNPSRWYHRIAELAEHNHGDTRQYRDLVELALPDQTLRDNLLEAIGPEMMVLVSRETPSATRPASLPTTTASSQKSSAGESSAAEIALVIRSKNPTLTMAAANQLFDMLSGLNTLQALITGNSSQGSRLAEENYHGLSVHQVNLGQVVPPDSRKRFAGWCPVLAWTQVQDYLLLASSPNLIHRLIDRAFALEETVMFGENILAELPPVIHWGLSFTPGEVAQDMKGFREVFEYFWKTMKDHSPSETTEMPVVLGIGTKVIQQAQSSNSMVQVAAVLPGYPCWERLRIGDILVSVDGRPISLEAPQKDLHKKVAQARSASSIRFGVLRKGEKMEIDVPLVKRSFNNTVRSMEMLSGILHTLGKKFSRIDLACRYTPEGQIFLDFNFVVRNASPATKPVTQPATLPTR